MKKENEKLKKKHHSDKKAKPPNPFFRSSNSQTFMSHSFTLALIYGLKVADSDEDSQLKRNNTVKRGREKEIYDDDIDDIEVVKRWC